MAKHFPAPWVDGVSSDVIVVKQKPEGFTNSMMIKAYGGYLVAETIASCNKPLIKRAPSMLTLLEKALPIIEEEAERRERASWTDTEGDYWSEMRELANEISAEIDKAKGKGVSDG